MPVMPRLTLLALLTPALWLTAAASSAAQISVASAQQAAQVEAALTRNPDDLNARSALMAFYSNEGDLAGFEKQMLWMLEHHPEAGQLSDLYSAEDDPQLEAAWDRALALHPDSPDVLFNGALFVERRNPQRALCLLGQAESTSAGRDDHGRYFDAIALIYAAAVMPGSRLNGIAMSFIVANALRSEIQTSADPALLSKVGTDLVRFNKDQEGLHLIERAIELDPNNSKWQEALESAKAEPVRRANLEAIYRSSRQR